MCRPSRFVTACLLNERKLAMPSGACCSIVLDAPRLAINYKPKFTVGKVNISRAGFWHPAT
jgi:hypothetical protein